VVEKNPSSLLSHLLERNRAWSDQIKKDDPEFFSQLADQQHPEYFWIGCSDSRVPANQITGLKPGEVFVHRNVANIVPHADLNCLSVLQYAVDVLKVKHIIVCGHYGCGGVQAALSNHKFGLIDNWLRNLKDIYRQHRTKIDSIVDADKTVEQNKRVNRLCELNVIEQVNNVCHTTIVQDAWDRGQPLTVHGWIYSIRNGLIKDMKVSTGSKEQISQIYRVESELESIPVVDSPN
jgi:carbonic anhydrase